MSKKLKIKFYFGIIIGILLFALCSFSEEMISIPIEIGIGAMVVMTTSVLVDNYDVNNDSEINIRAWQFKIFYCALLLVIISCAVFCADAVKHYLK